MASPKPFSIATPTLATEIPAKREGGRAGVDHGPNFFLQAIKQADAVGLPEDFLKYMADAKWSVSWFELSYAKGVWFDVPASGDFVMGVIEKGKNKGREVERMTGDLLEITRQLREAADTLKLGVAIKYFPQVYKSGAKQGQEVPGKWIVKYLAGNRKQKRTPAPAQSAPVAE